MIFNNKEKLELSKNRKTLDELMNNGSYQEGLEFYQNSAYKKFTNTTADELVHKWEISKGRRPLSMKGMQDKMFFECNAESEWPKPYVHFPGVVRLVHSPQEWEEVHKEDMMRARRAPLYAVIAVGIFYLIVNTLFG